MRFTRLFGMGAAFCCASAIAAPPTLPDLLRPSEHTLLTLSPGGDYVAGTVRMDGRVLLAIIDRKANTLVRALDPQKNGAVERVSWVNNERLFLMNSRTGGSVQQAYLEPEIVAINVDGSRKRAFYADVIDTLVDDDEQILVRRCAKSSLAGCWTYVQRSDNDGGRSGERVADAPMVDAQFMADNRGQVRFAYGRNDADIQQLWLLDGGKWAQINDEAATGVEVDPIGVSRDGTHGFLRSERVAGPDVIERINFADGTREVVLGDPLLDPVHVLWSADGTQPIGAAYGLGVPRGRFWDEADPDAQLLRQLEAAFPEDAVALTSGSRDGAYAVVSVWSDRDPGSYYLLDRAARRTSLIVRAKPWLSPDELAPSQPIALTARDGVALHGYLTMPLSGASKALVVLPHGGPFGVRDTWAYDEEVQILAAHGYASLRVNFRGSGGFGRAFKDAGLQQWGGKMQDDLTDATRWAVQQGHADPGRTCIWGTSYGGYAALMGAAQSPGLYRCVIATAAVTDLNLSWRWGDIQRSRYGQNYLEQAVGKDPRQLRAHSPVARAADIEADVLLVHGRRDSRVSFEHAKAMLAAFEKVGKSVEHDFFVNETHGIYGDENRERYYRRVLDFLGLHTGRGAVAGAAEPGTASGPAPR